MKLSEEDRDLLRWSGELDGRPTAKLRAELDELAISIRRLPPSSPPAAALSTALARNDLAHRTSPQPFFRLALYAAAAAVAVFGIASLLLSGPATPAKTAAPSAADPIPSATAFPVRIFPKSETSNLKRIRDARARILRIRSRPKPKITPDESQLHHKTRDLS